MVVAKRDIKYQLKCSDDKYFSDAFEGWDYFGRQMLFINKKKIYRYRLSCGISIVQSSNMKV